MDVKIFENKEFGSVRVVVVNETPMFVAKDVAVALGYQKPQNAILNHCKSGDALNYSTAYIPHSNGIGGTNLVLIGESNVYRLIMRSNLPETEKFQDWVCEDVLPCIRKHGAYMTEEVAKKVIESPDFLIQLATEIKEERRKRELAEQNLSAAEDKIKRQDDVIKHKSDVIEGLTDEIPTAELRQRIVQIVTNASPTDIPGRYRLLYEEFEKKYHINLNRRIWNALDKGIEYKSRLDYIDKFYKGKGIQDLYDIACVLFEQSVERFLKKRWKVKDVVVR